MSKVHDTRNWHTVKIYGHSGKEDLLQQWLIGQGLGWKVDWDYVGHFHQGDIQSLRLYWYEYKIRDSRIAIMAKLMWGGHE